MHLGGYDIDDLLTFTVNTHDPDTKENADADSAPSYRVYEDETGTPILTGTMALLDSTNTAGFYSEQITLSDANGFEAFKSYTIRIQATVGGVTGAMTHTFRIKEKVHVVTVADNAITASAINANAITAAKLDPDVTTELQSGLATAANQTTILNRLGAWTGSARNTILGAFQALFRSDADATVPSDVNADLGSGVGTANNTTEALQAIRDAAIDSATLIAAVRAGLVLAEGTIGSTGNDTTHIHLTGLTYGDDELNNCQIVIYDTSEDEYHSRWITDWVNSTALATIATLPFTPQNATDTYWVLPARQDVTGGSGLDAAGVRAAIGLASANLDTQLAALPTAAENADATWEEAIADHSGTSGSVAEALNAAGSAGDPWTTAIPGAYGVGSAGYILGNRVDAAISTRATPAQVNSEADTALSDVGLTTTVTGRIDAAISTRLASASYSAPPSASTIASQVRTELATELARIDAAVSTRLATAGYTVPLDAAGTRSALGMTSANLDTQLASLDALIDTSIAAIAALNNVSTAQVLTQVNTALDTAISELGVGAPTATPSIRTGLMLLYMALRNRTTSTASAQTIQNDAGTTIATAALSDDSTTFTKGEFA